MRTKTLLAILAAAALGAPLGALAHDSSASSGASMSSDTQSSSGNGQLAQSDSCGDSARLNCPQSTPTPGDDQSVQNSSSDEQSAQDDSSSSGQLAQSDTDSSLTAEPSDPQSTSPYGSTGDASTRNA